MLNDLIKKILDGYGRDLDELLNTLDFGGSSEEYLIKLLIEEGFINEESHPELFRGED
tara:strand:+ start:2224 stop:2397 length:174 start_codon:yes stop_codon:yes gene_type:complete